MKKIILICIAAITFCGLQAQNNWEKIGLPDSVNFSQIYCLDKNTVFAFGLRMPNTTLLYKTTDGGKNWKMVHKSTSKGKKINPEKITFADGKAGFAVIADRLFKTTDSGESWAEVSSDYDGFSSIGQLLAIDEEILWILQYDGCLFESIDRGESFHPIFGFLAGWYTGIACRNGVSYINYNIPSDTSIFTRISYISATNDKGITWELVTDALPINEAKYLNDLYFHTPYYATYGGKNHLIVTEDGFKTFSLIPYPIDYQVNIQQTIEFIDHSHGFFLSTESGISKSQLFYTEQGGKEWVPEFALDNERIVDVVGKEGVWYALPYSGNCLFKTTKKVKISEPAINSTFTLYPNPVTDILKIECDDCDVKQVEIYDITGRVVFKQESPAQSRVNIQHLTKGIYIAKIYAENQVFNTKIIKQ